MKRASDKPQTKAPIPGLSVTYLDEPRIVVFSIEDSISPDCVSRAEEAFNKILQQGYRLFVGDLSMANQVSSGGVGLLIYYHKRLAERGGGFVIVKPSPAVMRRLGTFLQPVFPMVDTREQAIALLRNRDVSG